MKNIHVLPTDKPSRLLKCRFKGHFILDPFTHLEGCFEEGFDPQHIYITNDEEISIGNFMLEIDTNFVLIAQKKYIDIDNYKKIILTTDHALIKDGVQAIDDEFLEWFVMNPSCERVEVEKEFIQTPDNLKDGFYYKIIIPEEELVNHSSSVLNNLHNKIPNELESVLAEIHHNTNYHLNGMRLFTIPMVIGVHIVIVKLSKTEKWL